MLTSVVANLLLLRTLCAGGNGGNTDVALNVPLHVAGVIYIE